MKLNSIVCDICGEKSRTVENPELSFNYTKIDLCLKINGSPDYSEVCVICTKWMIEVFDERKKVCQSESIEQAQSSEH